MGPTLDAHPDEGTIHAWLDGALDAASAEALAAHIATCPACAERVAEARGLIAGASRVVRALDEASAGVEPTWGDSPAARAAESRSVWRRLRVTPTRAAIAATLLVAVGVTATYVRTGPDTVQKAMLERSAAMAPAAPLARDSLLDSAVKRNIAQAQPPRAVEAAPGAGLPVPSAVPARAATAEVAAGSSGVRVAAGRAAVLAQRESTPPTADRARVGAEPATSEVAALSARSAGVTSRAYSPATECYRVESANGAAAIWGTVALPVVIALDSGSGLARLLTPEGRDTEGRAVWHRGGEDSLLFQLRRIGYRGSLALGAAGEVRAGVMRSSPMQAMLGQVVVTGGAPAVPVVAHRVSCPGR